MKANDKPKAALLKPQLTKQQELSQMVKEYYQAVEILEQNLVEFALTHNLPLVLGSDEDRKYLVLESGKDPIWPENDYPIDKVRGEWYHSYEV